MGYFKYLDNICTPVMTFPPRHIRKDGNDKMAAAVFWGKKRNTFKNESRKMSM